MSRQTPHGQPTRGSRTRGPQKPGRGDRPETVAPRPASVGQDPEVEAQRALLASPAVIARAGHPASKPVSPPKPKPKHTAAPRAAETTPSGTAKSAPRTAPRRAAPERTTEQRPDPTPPSSPRAAALLDVTRAQRLAREARLREQASRESLARTRASLATPILPEATAAAPVAEPAGWQRRALRSPARPEPGPAHEATTRPPAPARPAPVPPSERVLAAELREARATLAIARETTRIQRDEIARLRAALEVATANAERVPRESPAHPPADAADRAALRGRIAELEAALEQAGLERAEYHRAMASHQQELVERSRRQAALQERFDVLESTLDQTRRQAELERRRHTEAQTLLERLRATLRGVELDSPATAPATATATAPEPRLEELPSPLPTPIMREATAPVRGTTRSPIFSFWLEEQVRRNFGPLGIDSIADLLRDPIARRAEARADALPILIVGPGVAREARSLAESLVRAGSPAFTLFVADPEPGVVAAPSEDDPLRGILRRRAFPDRPEALRDTLIEVAPAVVLTRELLTGQADVAPWLEVLRAATAAGAALVLLEQTGQGAVTPSAELLSIGERIWELLPERYTRDPATGETIGSFREAFAARATAPRNQLLSRLREGFSLELCAQFGFLAEAFVSGPIAGCFDPSQARDQRFLKQIADVDERRLESGSAGALHLIARVDPRQDPAL